MKDCDTNFAFAKGIISAFDEILAPAANLKDVQKTEEHVNYTMYVHLAKSRLLETARQGAQVLQQ